MLDAILFVILGLVVFWLLAAIFEAIGFTKHPYVARGFAALLTIAGACIGTGYQHWWQVLIGIGAAFVYLQTLRKSLDKSGQESK
jgi:O-antigen ligase